MASLTGQQLKDSYQSLLTIGDSIVPNPTSGQLENGLGNPITALGIGTDSPDVELQVASDRNGKIRIESTVSALNANDLAGAFEVYKNDASTNGVGVFGSLNVYSQDLGGSSYLTLNTSGSDGNNQARLRIDSSGTIQVRNQTPTIQLYNTDTSLSNEQTLGDLDWYQNDPSGSGVNVVAKIRGVNESSFQGQGALAFHVGASGSASEKVRIDSLGNVGIGATSITAVGSRKTLHINDSSGSAIRLSESSTDIAFLSYDSTSFFRLSSSDQIALMTAGSEAMRIDSSGNVGIGTSTVDDKLHVVGTSTKIQETGQTGITMKFNHGNNASVNSDINIANIKSFVSSGSTGSEGGGLTFETKPTSGSATERMRIDSNGNILPGADDSQDLGSVTKRFDDVYATNGTIQTSDRNEKQDIEELNDAELRVAQQAKTLLRKFRWKSSVEEKGDEARIHFGIIAQDLEQAFTDEGLDAGRYGMFIKSTWTNEDGEEQTRLGVRYNQLLAFIISAL